MTETIITIQEPSEIIVIEDGTADEIIQITNETVEVVEIAERGLPGIDGNADDTDYALIYQIAKL